MVQRWTCRTMLALVLGSLGATGLAEPGVAPFGTYPFELPGLTPGAGAKPRVLVWCQGVKLVGVLVLPDEGREKAAAAPAATRPAPAAILLRDGRCEAEGGRVSFGFFVPRKAWVFESAARSVPEEKTAWLLHRFEGAASAGQLKGMLVQVDVSHPGLAFREARVEVDALQEEQASFPDESGWLASVSRAYSLETGLP